MSPPFAVQPGESVGPFHLSDSLWHILDVLRTDKTSYPKIELSWDTSSPHISPITLHLPHPGLTLFFPHPLQRLGMISITLPAPLSLAFETQMLASPTQPLTRARVGRVLGPTYSAGEVLKYPGVEFTLKGDGGRDEAVERVKVIPREGQKVESDPIRSCIIQPGRGATLLLPDPYEVMLGETTGQDLLLDLGPPLRKFWKEDDRMARMWGADSEAHDGECFWNYFQFGLDFLLSAEGVVIKIIAHSNIPGTPLFQRYARCPWSLPTSNSSLDHTSPISSFQGNLPPPSAIDTRVAVINGEGGKRLGGSPASVRSAQSAGSEGKVGGEPTNAEEGAGEPDAMLLDRIGEGGLDDVVGVGTSRLVGFEGVILEVDEASGGISSVLVYQHHTTNDISMRQAV